ncbi:MAG: helix-turn-helix transcriptional regulator [Gammaproteobacteria bacterium]|nr:helix-turn-helix transcriptional regulator [Gammaproteobacteria bacterium]
MNTQPVGMLLREWRQRRHRSQLDLALDADISTKHLSFVETGRAQPSREMVLHLSELLQIPLRDRNAVLVSAGFAPMFPERTLDDPALAAARRAVDLVLAGHEPYPALAVDRHWNLITANQAANRLLGSVDPAMLQPPLNVLRLSLHPGGMAPQIVNLAQWREHLLMRLHKQIHATADAGLMQLAQELEAYPVPAGAKHERARADEYGGVVVPLQLQTPLGMLSLISITTLFGTPLDVTIAELALESFFPADARTAELLRQFAGQS